MEVNNLKWSVLEVTKRHLKSRSSHRSCSVRKADHRNLTKFTGKHLCWSLFFNKVAGLRPAILSKKRLWHRCFSVNFAKFPRTPFLQNTSRRLLLHVFGYGCWWKWYDAVTKICQKKIQVKYYIKNGSLQVNLNLIIYQHFYWRF